MRFPLLLSMPPSFLAYSLVLVEDMLGSLMKKYRREINFLIFCITENSNFCTSCQIKVLLVIEFMVVFNVIH